MNSLVAGILGQISEDDSVPVPITRPRQPKRSRENMRPEHRRTVAAIMGMAEAEENGDDEAVIPDDAKEIENVMGTGVKVDGDAVDKDREPRDPDVPNYGDGEKEQLMTPAVALVAPDVTPDALKPLDPSQVPQPPISAASPPPVTATASSPEPDAALRVLLGKGPNERDSMPPVLPVTAESAQAVVNGSLGVAGGGPGLNQGQPMPEHQPGQPAKIMEAFYRFGGNVKNTWKL